MAVDCLGLILAMMITPAGVQDRDAARPLIKTRVRLYGRLPISWADGGYLGALVNGVKQLRPFGKLRLEIVRRCDDVKGFNLEAAVDAAAKARLQSATSGNGGNLPLEVCEITAGVSPNG